PSALVLCCLALFVALHAADYVCDPNGNNQPDCSNATNQEVKIRNFFDPTRYWWCNSSNVAEGVPCELRLDNGTLIPRGFDVQVGDCVTWDLWKWSPNC
ncbi:hypothetical protein KR038_007370, partial [Drosophila bunnanda]